MGPQSLLAEITRPIDLQPSARPTISPAETPAGRFSDRLRDALGAQSREPAHSLQESNAPVEDPLGETAQTSAPHPDQQSHGQDREETLLPDAPGQDVAPEAEQAAIPEPIVTAVEPPPAFAELDRHLRLRSVHRGSFHLLRNETDPTAPVIELFDLTADPIERDNLIGTDRAAAIGRDLIRRLDTH